MNHQSLPNGDLQAQLVGRAMTDETFRERLLATPKATIEEALGVTLPASLEIVVVEETASRVCLVLPPRTLDVSELSEEDLSKVAGGGPRQYSMLSNVLKGFGGTQRDLISNLK
jgi:Nitrile hydratase, alpha chain